MEGRKQFTFYRSYADAIRHLDPQDQLAVLTAIIDYALDGRESQSMTAVQKAMFCLIKPVLDTGRKKATCGKHGGSKTQANRKHATSEKEKEVEVEKEVENEIEDECLADSAGFESFWKEYPVKVGKAKTLQVWNKLMPELSAVMNGLHRWKHSRQWDREDGRFIPRAWRWLEEKQYLDQPEPLHKVPMGATGVLGEAELDAIRRVMQE